MIKIGAMAKTAGAIAIAHKADIFLLASWGCNFMGIREAIKIGPDIQEVKAGFEDEGAVTLFTEYAKVSWKLFAWEGAAMAFSVLSRHQRVKEINELSAALIASQALANNWQQEAESKASSEAEKDEMRERVANKQVAKSEFKSGPVNVIHTGHGDELFQLEFDGRYFTANRDWIRLKCNEFGQDIGLEDDDDETRYSQMHNDNTMNDLFSYLKLDRTKSGELFYYRPGDNPRPDFIRSDAPWDERQTVTVVSFRPEPRAFT